MMTKIKFTVTTKICHYALLSPLAVILYPPHLKLLCIPCNIPVFNSVIYKIDDTADLRVLRGVRLVHKVRIKHFLWFLKSLNRRRHRSYNLLLTQSCNSNRVV